MVCDVRRYSVNWGEQHTATQVQVSHCTGHSAERERKRERERERERERSTPASVHLQAARLHVSGAGRASFSNFTKVLCGLVVAPVK